MYMSDYFTEEQMTKYEILSDANKVLDKTLAHFTELLSLSKAYGDDRAANSGFESAAHIRDHYLLAASSQPTPREASCATSTSRASRNHSRQPFQSAPRFLQKGE